MPAKRAPPGGLLHARRIAAAGSRRSSSSGSASRGHSPESSDASPRSRRNKELTSAGPTRASAPTEVMDGDLYVADSDDDSGSRKRKPRPAVCLMGALQGRFSGRLVSKQDEARLIEECQRLGPLLGGASGGIEELKRTQLSQIVRAIASGEVCDHLQCICNMQQRLEEQLKDRAAAAAHQERELVHQRALVQNLNLQLQQLRTAGDGDAVVRLQALPQEQFLPQQDTPGGAAPAWATDSTQQQRPPCSNASTDVAGSSDARNPFTSTTQLLDLDGSGPAPQWGDSNAASQAFQVQRQHLAEGLPDCHVLSRQLASTQVSAHAYRGHGGGSPTLDDQGASPLVVRACSGTSSLAATISANGSAHTPAAGSPSASVGLVAGGGMRSAAGPPELMVPDGSGVPAQRLSLSASGSAGSQVLVCASPPSARLMSASTGSLPMWARAPPAQPPAQRRPPLARGGRGDAGQGAGPPPVQRQWRVSAGVSSHGTRAAPGARERRRGLSWAGGPGPVPGIAAAQGRSWGGGDSRGGADNNTYTNAVPEQNLTEWQQQLQLQQWEHHSRRQEVPEHLAAQALATPPSLEQHEHTLRQQQLAERQTFQRQGINEQPQLQQCQLYQHHQPPADQPGSAQVLGAHPQPQHQSPALPSSRDPANFTIPPHRTTISNATPGSRGAPSYLERQLHSGNLMVWEAGARQPGSPPPGYGPVAMGPGAVPCTSHVFARHNQMFTQASAPPTVGREDGSGGDGNALNQLLGRDCNFAGRSSSSLIAGAASAAAGASMLEEPYFSAPVAAGPESAAQGASEDLPFLRADVMERLPPGVPERPASTSMAWPSGNGSDHMCI